VKERMAELTLFTVSSGTPAATLNLVLARMLGARSVVNMTPSLLPRRHFALNVVPAHDVTAGTRLPANVVVTPLALGYHERAAAELMAGQLAVEHRLERAARYWGVAIGGPSRACPWVGDRILDELAALHGLAKQHGAELLVTTSRRTPAYCTAWLRKHYLGSPQLAYFLDAAEDPLNPLPALYELSVRMFVTTDSFSMVSEAVHAGHRPVLLRVRVGCPPGKLGRALTMLEGKGLAVLGDEDAGLAARLLAEPGRADPNRHYEMLSGQVRAKLGLSS
jgi:mitochondrial fission protein ELM1